jgi:hypothetical protein
MKLLIMQFLLSFLLYPHHHYSTFLKNPLLGVPPYIVNQVSYPRNATDRILVEDLSVLECS